MKLINRTTFSSDKQILFLLKTLNQTIDQLTLCAGGSQMPLLQFFLQIRDLNMPNIRVNTKKVNLPSAFEDPLLTPFVKLVEKHLIESNNRVELKMLESKAKPQFQACVNIIFYVNTVFAEIF
jgi:hypothetical protein